MGLKPKSKFNYLDIMLAGKRVVVCGYGDVGKGTAASFQGAGSILTGKQ